MNENLFNIENQYKKYLKLAGLDESKMPNVQGIETKRTFYCAFGQLLMLLTNEISELPEEKGVLVLDDMISQVEVFLVNEVKNQN